MPPDINWLAMNKAVDPVAQLLLTLNIGIPVIPNGYKALCPQVESPWFKYENSMKERKKVLNGVLMFI